MPLLRLTLLGGFQARNQAGEVLSVPSRKAQAMLAYLALPLGRAHPRDKLAALLWGGIREESARASLRQALFVVRKALQDADADALDQKADTLRLEPHHVDADVEAFERAATTGTPESLMRAASLYQGDLLAGLALDEAPFEEWLVSERERLRELALEVLARLLTHHRKGGSSEASVQTALKLLALDPLQEAVHRTLMRLYADTGRREAALRQYQHCVRVLQRELGIEPEAATKVLYQEILRQRPRRAIAPTAPAARVAARAGERQSVGTEIEIVGRSQEIERLSAELTSAASGMGRVVGVLGEAGIGKSRLVAELADHAIRRGMAVVIGRSYESEQILPFGPWVDALRAGHVADDAELLARLTPAVRAELARLVPDISGSSSPAAATTDMRLIFESVAELLGHLADRRPLLWVLEDLHWADEISARLVAFAGRRLVDRPILLVVTAREEELGDVPTLRQAFADLRREGRLTTLALGPLSREDTQRLVRAIGRSGDATALDRLADQAWAASEGNPFVAVETVRAHAEGAWIAHGSGLAIPERVREIVGRRLERLSDRGQALSAVAAVIGREFEFSLLQRAAGLGEEETAVGVEELVRRGVIHGRGEHFDFTHDRIREVARARILAPRRKLIHRRVAEAIEALYAADLDTHALALGLHYRDAEMWDPAARYLGNAGFAARERAANREAVACFDEALRSLANLPEARGRSERVIDTLLHKETALMGLGEFRQSLDGLREAEGLARGLGDRRRLGRVFGRFAYNLGSLGDLDGATDNAHRARAIAIDLADSRSHFSSNVVRARALYARGDYREAMEAVRENDALALGAPAGPIGAGDWPSVQELPAGQDRIHNLSFTRIWGVLALAELGEFAEAIRRSDEALRVSAAELGRHGDVWAHLGVGRLYLVKGDLSRAIEVLEQGLPMCEVGGDLAVYFSRTATSLGGAYALAGRLEEAVAILERADRHAGSIGFAYGHALVVATLGEAKLLRGHIDDAAGEADRALGLCRHHGQRGWEAWTLRLIGEIALRRDPPDVTAARAAFAAACALATERGMRPLLAHCRLGQGAVHRRAGESAHARAEVVDALAEYRAMDMIYWQARAEAELASLP
jgi:DNA-binding SARP family transcriptional activator